MPRAIEIGGEAKSCTLGDCVGALTEQGFDPHEEASLLHAAGWLRRLDHNRDFLAETMLGELAARHREDSVASTYGPQVIMLSQLCGEFFIRANIWPSPDEHFSVPAAAALSFTSCRTITTSIS